MKKKFQETSLINIKIGDIVLHNKKRVIVRDIKLVPNGTFHTDRTLIALVSADYVESSGKLVAASTKFEPSLEESYEMLYPSDMLK